MTAGRTVAVTVAGSAPVRAEDKVAAVGAVMVALPGSAVGLAPLRVAVAEGRVVVVVATSAAVAVVAGVAGVTVVTVAVVAVVAERETVAALAEAMEVSMGAAEGFVCEPHPSPSNPVLPPANPSLLHATPPRFLRAVHTCRPGEAPMP